MESTNLLYLVVLQIADEYLFKFTNQVQVSQLVLQLLKPNYPIHLISSSAQIASDISGSFTAGSGLDLSSGEFSVDVSDFMSNGVDNRVLTATGTDGHLMQKKT